MVRFLILLLALFGVIHCQVIYNGSCPDVKWITDFKVSNYMGRWYDYSRYFYGIQNGTRCNSGYYILNDNGTISMVETDTINATGELEEGVGLASLAGKANEGRFSIVFPGLNPINQIIVGTDYKNWSAVYFCNDLGDGTSARFAWILTRTRKPSKQVLKKAKAAFAAQKLATDILQKINQRYCIV